MSVSERKQPWLWAQAPTAPLLRKSEPFGSVIKRYRRAANLTQEQAASRLHVDQSYLSKIETRKRIINDLGLLARVAQVLQIPPHELGLSDELYAAAGMRDLAEHDSSW